MTFASFVFAAVLAGGAKASHEERASLLKQPVNCETAADDIVALEAAMPSPGERAKSAILSLTPVGAVASVVTGNYKNNAAILTGRTKDELTARIKEIQTTCDIPEKTESGNP